MTLRDRVRQLVVVGFGGTQAPADLIRRIHPGGLIYFSPNLRSTPQIRAMSRRAQLVARRSGQPLLLMTDQEGGLVTRLPGTSAVPGGPTSKEMPAGRGAPQSGPAVRWSTSESTSTSPRSLT